MGGLGFYLVCFGFFCFFLFCYRSFLLLFSFFLFFLVLFCFVLFWFGLVWFDLFCFGLVWFGFLFFSFSLPPLPPPPPPPPLSLFVNSTDISWKAQGKVPGSHTICGHYEAKHDIASLPRRQICLVDKGMDHRLYDVLFDGGKSMEDACCPSQLVCHNAAVLPSHGC